MPNYQGWTNRETWLVALWLNNEQGLQDTAQSIARTTQLREAEQELSQWVQDLAEDHLKGPGRPSFVMDMIGDYLAGVNWTEIVESLREE